MRWFRISMLVVAASCVSSLWRSCVQGEEPNVRGGEETLPAGRDGEEPDKPRTRWFVYRDVDSEENHGHWTNIMPAEGADMITTQLGDKNDPAYGTTCVRLSVKFQRPFWCGLAVSSAPDYWGEKPSDEVYDLSGAEKLVFYARGDTQGKQIRIQVKVAIAGDKRYGDSAKAPAATKWISLTDRWQRYELEIDQRQTNLRRTITPFCVVTSQDHNDESEIHCWFDQIYFVMRGDQ